MNNEKKAIATLSIAAVNVVVFVWLSLGGMTEEPLYMLGNGAMYTPFFVQSGEYYRIFTSMFLHFGFEHLMNNMVILCVVGWNVEQAIGGVRLVIIYLLSGLGGNLLSMVAELLTGDYAISAGASGAVFGLTGALLALTLLNRGRTGGVSERGMVFMVLASLYLGFTSEGVDNVAHIGGLLTGMAVTCLIGRKTNEESRAFFED